MNQIKCAFSLLFVDIEHIVCIILYGICLVKLKCKFIIDILNIVIKQI